MKIEGQNDRSITATAATKRIFVGGLGWSVTADDLRKTFSSLGKVESVDIVPTKGRRFAYLDFLPSTEKSLPKLFSMYNGCMWKGGRLRLEMAKEHYLSCLRREWAEDAELAICAPGYDVDAAENMCSSKKKKEVPNQEKMQLRIFFPKLKKVKLVPLSGTGKHKYSFQRIDAPSLPIHFCDCDEHSDPSPAAKERDFCYLGTESGGINQEELNTMNSVMNKLFEHKNFSRLAEEGEDVVNNSIDNVRLEENEECHVTDEDNIIINMVAGPNNRIAALDSQELEAISANQESIFIKPHASKDRLAWKMQKSEKGRITPSNKKRKSPLTEENDGNKIARHIPERKGCLQTHLNGSETHLGAQTRKPESGTLRSADNLSWSQKSAWRNLVGERVNTPFHLSHIMPVVASAEEKQPRSDDVNVPYSFDRINRNLIKHENLESKPDQSKELKELSEALPAKPNVVMNKSARGASWLQKSSWTQLLGDTNNSSFSISQVLPSSTSEKQELLEPNGMDAANLIGSKQFNLYKSKRSESTRDGSKTLGVQNEVLLAACKRDNDPVGLNVEQSNPEKKQLTVGENNQVSAPIHGKRHLAAPKQTSAGNFGIGETCSFVRSAASMREWVNTKAALTGSLKKKSK